MRTTTAALSIALFLCASASASTVSHVEGDAWENFRLEDGIVTYTSQGESTYIEVEPEVILGPPAIVTMSASFYTVGPAAVARIRGFYDIAAGNQRGGATVQFGIDGTGAKCDPPGRFDYCSDNGPLDIFYTIGTPLFFSFSGVSSGPASFNADISFGVYTYSAELGCYCDRQQLLTEEPAAVPEPSVVYLSGIGLIALCVRKKVQFLD